MIERIPGPFAAIYEKAARLVIATYYSRVAEEVVSRLRKGLVLDLGTGPGYLPIEIAKKAPLMRCDGIDLSRKLIRLARSNAQRAGVSDRVRFEIGNAAKLRFDDGSYDMVISTGMFHSLNEPVGVLRESYRLLRSGGETWIYDPARIASSVDMKEWKASLTPRERLIFRLFPIYRRLNPANSYRREQVMAMVGATKFKDCQIEKNDDELRIKLRK